MDLASDILGDSPPVSALRDEIRRIAGRLSAGRAGPPVVIVGETGTGKGLVARALHRLSARSRGPFIDVNCAAIPVTLLESEMFGVERGAFTDARQTKAGLFQSAQLGTIFLDEVALLPEGSQAKLLKVIEERSVRRVGSTRAEPIDVWIIAATNENLEAAVRAGRFREDLYHRLAVVILRLPPLRDRHGDVLLLARHFLDRFSREYGLGERTFTADAEAALEAHPWPGNIRELANMMERVAVLADGPRVDAAMLGLRNGRRPQPAGVSTDAARPATTDEAQTLADVLQETDWNISRAAARLGISRNAIRYRIEKQGLERAAGARGRSVARRTPPSAAPGERPTPPLPRPTTLRWERRRVTLMKSSVVTGEAMPAHALTHVIQMLIDKAQTFGAKLEEVTLTGIVAVFGLEPGDDAPRRAAHAAVAITRAVERERAENDRPPLAVRVALHLCPVTVARVGDDATIDPDSKRHALAAIDDIAELAPEGGVLVSEAAARFLQRRFELVRIGDARAYALRHARERSPAGGGGGRAGIFVGRERELGLLRSMFEAAATGRGGVVGITGDAGLGKSRLLAQFREGLHHDFSYLEGRCLPYGTGIPYLPILDLVRGVAGINESDRPVDVAAKLGAVLAGLDLDGTDLMAPLCHLLTVSLDTTPALAPEAVKAGIFEALRRLVVALSSRSPVVLAVEDLQWVDSLSAELLASLSGIVAARPILMLTTYRSGYRPPWSDRSYATQLALSGLTAAESRTLVRARLDSPEMREDTEPVIEMLLAKAEGNPFFLEELALVLREQPGHSPDAVPDTVHDVIVGRIDRLSAEHRAILQAAAVIGRTVPFWLLRAVVDDPDDTLHGALDALRAGEFLYETTFDSEPDHAFKHALTHEVAYATVADMSRRDLHRRVVEAIERRHPEKMADHAERLAHHATCGEVWRKAVAYWRQAGLRALSHSSHEEAVACFEQALAALQRLPAGRDSAELGVDLRFDVRSAMLPLGRFTAIRDHLLEAQRLAESLSDELRLGRACAYLTSYFRQVGDHARGLEAGQRGLALARAHGDLPLEVTTHIYLAHVFYDTGRFREAGELLQRTVDSVSAVWEHERFGLPYIVSVHSRTWLAVCLAELGHFPDAFERAEEAMRIAEAAEHPSSLTSAHVAVGRVHLRRGDMPNGVPVLQRGVELSRRWNIRLLFPFLAEALGLAYVYSGRPHDGLPLLREAQAVHAAMRGDAGQSIRLVSLSEGHLAAGDTEDADRLAARGLEMARRYEEMGNVAYALLQCGEVALARAPGDPEAAMTHYRAALTTAEELQMRPLAARCRLRLAIAGGQRADVTAAAELVRVLGMPLWLEQAERALAALG